MLGMIKDILPMRRVITSKLPYIVFFITSRCNLKCKHCFYWKKIESFNKEEELNFDEIQKISKNLGKIYYLTLTGGEPTLRNDLIDIIKVFYKQNDVKHLALHSNGFYPKRLFWITEEVLKNCPSMTFEISLSIDGFEENHDKIRSAKGSFKKMIESAEMLKKLKHYPNFVLNLNTTLMCFNKKDIIKIHKFVTNRLKLSHDVTYLRGEVRECKTKGDFLEIYKEIAKIIDKEGLNRKDFNYFSLIRKCLIQVSKDFIIKTKENKEKPPSCQALRKALVINESGEVFPCEVLNRSLGNLRNYNYNITKILGTKKVKIMKQWIKRTKCKCTWECIIPLNIIFSLKGNLMLIKKLIDHHKQRLLNNNRI